MESSDEVAEHTEKILKEGADTFETKHRKKDGEIRDIEVSCRAISIGGRDFIQSMWRDITEEKRARETLRSALDELEVRVRERTAELTKANEELRAGQERLRGLSRRLVEVQEAERRHIARELHDEVGQVLTGLRLLLEIGAHLSPEEVKGKSEEARMLVNDLIARVRDLSLDLRPAMLDDLGLVPALLWHFERYTSQTDVRVIFEHTGLEGRFGLEVETAVYRIVQEGLTNVARHAGVSEVTVQIWDTRDTLNAQIEDQGTGFDASAVLTSGQAGGLSGMRERTVSLGGQLIVESVPGSGTRLMAELSLGRCLGKESV